MGALYSDVQAVAEALSPLEKELLKLAGKGLSAVEICNKVNIPPEQGRPPRGRQPNPSVGATR